jgi:pilus assembly protein FimV
MPYSILEWTMSNGKNPLMLMMAMTVPGAAHALGLGDIHVTSGLNERLSADIDIVGATSVELTGLRASIATRDLFARYGFDRPAFLSSMTFKVGKDAQGHPVLSMTSTDSFNEPVVNLLVDVQWGNGQLVREYTLLLDPVGFAPVPRQAASGATQPAAPSDTRAAEPTDSDDGTASSAPAAETAAATGGAAVAAQDDTGGHADPAARTMTHIKVGPRATLRGIAWRIGERTESDLQRMMIAIFRANPGAFEGNINILHLGAVLTIPTDDQIESISRADAKREVHEQMVAWRAAAPERAAKFAARAAAARAESHAAAEPTAAPGAAAASAAAAVTRSSAAPGSTAASASMTAGAAATVAAGTTAARIASPGTASPGPAADSTPAPGNETAQALNQRIQSLEQELRDLKGTLDQERDQLAAMQAYAARAELAKAVAQQNATAHAAAPTHRTAPAADAKAEAAGGAQPSRHGLALPVIGGLGLLGAALAGIYMRMRRRSESEAPIGGRVDLAPPPAGQLEPVQTRRTAPPPAERAYEVVETVPVRALSADPALEPTSKLRQLGLDQASLEDSQRVQAILEGTGDDPTNRLPAMAEDSVSRYSYGGQADPSHEPTVRMRAEDAMSGRADGEAATAQREPRALAQHEQRAKPLGPAHVRRRHDLAAPRTHAERAQRESLVQGAPFEPRGRAQEGDRARARSRRPAHEAPRALLLERVHQRAGVPRGRPEVHRPARHHAERSVGEDCGHGTAARGPEPDLRPARSRAGAGRGQGRAQGEAGRWRRLQDRLSAALSAPLSFKTPPARAAGPWRSAAGAPVNPPFFRSR